MFAIELSDCILVEPGHFEIVYGESSLLNGVDNFSDVLVRARLDHCKCRLSISSLFIGSSDVSILFNSK